MELPMRIAEIKETNCFHISLYILSPVHILLSLFFLFLSFERLILFVDLSPTPTLWLDWVYTIASIIIFLWKLFNSIFLLVATIQHTQALTDAYYYSSLLAGCILSVGLMLFDAISIFTQVNSGSAQLREFVTDLYLYLLLILFVEFIIFIAIMLLYAKGKYTMSQGKYTMSQEKYAMNQGKCAMSQGKYAMNQGKCAMSHRVIKYEPLQQKYAQMAHMHSYMSYSMV